MIPAVRWARGKIPNSMTVRLRTDVHGGLVGSVLVLFEIARTCVRDVVNRRYPVAYHIVSYCIAFDYDLMLDAIVSSRPGVFLGSRE